MLTFDGLTRSDFIQQCVKCKFCICFRVNVVVDLLAAIGWVQKGTTAWWRLIFFMNQLLLQSLIYQSLHAYVPLKNYGNFNISLLFFEPNAQFCALLIPMYAHEDFGNYHIYIYISGICMVILSEYVFWQLNGVFCCSFQGGAFYFYFYFLLFIYFFECHPCSMMCCAFGLIGQIF